MLATYICFPLAPLGWHLWLFRCLSRPSEARLAKLGILEHYNEDAAFTPKHLPLIILDMHSCKHKLAQITETIQVGLQEATCWLISLWESISLSWTGQCTDFRGRTAFTPGWLFSPPFSKTSLGSSVQSWLPGFLLSKNNLPICIYMKLTIHMQCHVLTETRYQKPENQ